MPQVKVLKKTTGRLAELAASDTILPVNLGTGTANASTFLRGDGAWSSIPAASLAGARYLMIAASGGDYTTIGAAITYLNGLTTAVDPNRPQASTPWVLRLHGTFTESVTVPMFVHIEGVSQRGRITGVLTFGENTQISNIAITNTAAQYAVVYAPTGTAAAGSMINCTIASSFSNDGITSGIRMVPVNGAFCVLYTIGINIESTNVNAGSNTKCTGFYIDAGGTTAGSFTFLRDRLGNVKTRPPTGSTGRSHYVMFNQSDPDKCLAIIQNPNWIRLYDLAANFARSNNATVVSTIVKVSGAIAADPEETLTSTEDTRFSIGDGRHVLSIDHFPSQRFDVINRAYYDSTFNGSMLAHEKGVIVPFYKAITDAYTDVDLQALLDLIRKYPNIKFTVIANTASSGPGTVNDPNIDVLIKLIIGAGGYVIGYVDTTYGAKTVANVKAEILKWRELYPLIDGIFFDQVGYGSASGAPAEAARRADYKEIRQYSENLGYGPLFFNPGAPLLSDWYSTGDNVFGKFGVVIISEGTAFPLEADQKGFFNTHLFHPVHQRGMILKSQTSASETSLATAIKYYGWIHLASDTTYQAIPSFYESFLRILHAVSSGSQEKEYKTMGVSFGDGINSSSVVIGSRYLVKMPYAGKIVRFSIITDAIGDVEVSGAKRANGAGIPAFPLNDFTNGESFYNQSVPLEYTTSNTTFLANFTPFALNDNVLFQLNAAPASATMVSLIIYVEITY